MIGKITRVSLREVWVHEARDFSAWLKDNLDVLSHALGLSIVSADAEQAAGSFSVDLVGKTDEGETVVIENQLERSDHDHLGKLLTYLVAFDATTAVWIVADPRLEHVSALAWLNESSSASFYLVKAEAIRIGESPAACLMTLIVGPSAEAKEVGKQKTELAERHLERRQFWTQLLEKAKQRTRLHANRSPGVDHWISAGAGISGLSFNYVLWDDRTAAEFYIDRGADRIPETKAAFDRLLASKLSVERTFGGPLEWERRDGGQGSRVRVTIPGGGRVDVKRWPEIQDRLIDAMCRLEAAIRPEMVALKQTMSGSEQK